MYSSFSIVYILSSLIFFHFPTNAYDHIIDVLSQDARFEILVTHVQRTGLVPYLNSLEAATLFAPDNEAFGNYSGAEITKETLLYHLLPVGMTGEDFFHGQLLESLYVRPRYLGADHTGQRIKVSKEGNPHKGRGKVFINDAQIIDKDIFVNNQTLIQVVDHVLTPPEDIAHVLEHRTELFPWIQKVNLDLVLRQPKPFTVFATHGDPFLKYNAIEKTYITSSFGTSDLKSLVKYMVVEGAIYSANIPSGKTVYKTLTGESIVVAVSKDGDITVNDIPVKEPDIVAANGIIYDLEVMIRPPTLSFNARKYLYGLNATTFVTLLDQYGLGQYLQDEQQNVTFLALSNNVIDEDDIPNVQKHDWLSYHLVNGSWTSDQLKNGMMLSTLLSTRKLDGNVQQLPVYVDTEEIYTTEGSAAKTVRFDRARVVGDVVMIGNTTIYLLSDSLVLPGDMLSRVVEDLDLSTFIASLYVSKVAEEIRSANGITLFVPTNDAFQKLGLAANYLVQPSALADLQSVLRYHTGTSLLYRSDMQSEVHEFNTLANVTLRASPTKDHKVIVGRPDTEEGGYVCAFDYLAENGVVHKIDHVEIPLNTKITNRHLLLGAGASTMIKLLEKANMLDELEKSDYIILAPSDNAFAHMDIDALYENPANLERLVKLHILPQPWQDTWSLGSHDCPSILSPKDKVILRANRDEISIHVKDGDENEEARVTGRGKATVGRGGVMAMDVVLTPVHRGIFGLPWGWSIAVAIACTMIISSILGFCSFLSYKIWNRRRLGYRAI